MHSLARRYIKTAILFLALGLGLGLWMIVRREFAGVSPSGYLTTAHTHVILVGFVMMMILGVALWLFPRPGRADDRYSPTLAKAAYWLITIGTTARAGGEILSATRVPTPLSYLPVVIVSGASLQVGGLLLFFYTIWTRIRPAGSREREAHGERF